MGRTTRAPAAMAAALACACSAQVTEVPLDDLDFAYAFLVTADDGGLPLRVSSVGLRGDAEMDRGLPGTVLEGRETQFYLVSLTEEALQAVLPGLDLARVHQLELERVAPPARPAYVNLADGINQKVRVELPPGTRIHSGRTQGGVMGLSALQSLSVEASRLKDRLTLVVPVDSEHCRRPGQTPLRPFASTLTPFMPAVDDAEEIMDLTWATPDRLLVALNHYIMLIDRGQSFEQTDWPGPFEPAPGLLLLDVQPVLRPNETIKGAILSDDEDGQGRREVIVYGGIEPSKAVAGGRTSTVSIGWVRSAWLTAEGLVWDESERFEVDAFLVDAAFTPQGGVLLGGDRGVLVHRGPQDEAFSRLAPLRIFDPVDDTLRRLVNTGHHETSMIAGTDGRIHVFHESTQRWIDHDIIQPNVLSAESYKFYGLAAEPATQEDLRIWASTQVGDIVYRPDRLTDFDSIDLDYPPRFAPCASPAVEGEPLAYDRRDIADIAFQDGYALAAYHDCTGLVQIRPPTADEDTFCVTFVAPENEIVDHANDIADFRRHLAVHANEVAVATQRGIYVSSW